MEHWHPSQVERVDTLSHVGWDRGKHRQPEISSLILVADGVAAAARLAAQLRDRRISVTHVPAIGCALAYLYAGGVCDGVVIDVTSFASSDLESVQRIVRVGPSLPLVILENAAVQGIAELVQSADSLRVLESTRRRSDLADQIRMLIADIRTAAERGFDADVIECGALRLKPKVCRAYWRDRKVPLTMTEFRIVLKLASQPDEDVSYRDIYDVVHGEGFIAGEGDQGYRANVRSLIKKIRKKFGAIDDGFDAIENYPGFGYRWIGGRRPVPDDEPHFGHLPHTRRASTIPPHANSRAENKDGTPSMGALRRDRSADNEPARRTDAKRRDVRESRDGEVDMRAGEQASSQGRGNGTNGMNGKGPNGAADLDGEPVATEPSDNLPVRRPWGYFQTVDAGDRFQVKRIIVQPGSRLSLQMHHHRAEHWIVVHGTARVFRDGETLLLRSNEALYIPSGAKHRLENPGKVPLLLIEVQWGDYLGEDDIVRFEDSYGRV